MDVKYLESKHAFSIIKNIVIYYYTRISENGMQHKSCANSPLKLLEKRADRCKILLEDFMFLESLWGPVTKN